MPFVILPTNSASGGYDITNSLRFNSASSDNLSRTPSASNRKTWTFSTWIKFSRTGSNQGLLVAGASYTEFGYLGIKIGSGDYFDVTNGVAVFRRTTALFRDVSAWYHFVVSFDTTQATASNRVKVYVNGSQITDFSISNDPASNTDYGLNSNALTTVGRNSESAGEYFNGYMAETFFIDGQQLTPTSFGETDEDTGIWKPKAYTGTFGTNGFYLEFQNSGALGTDSSGNGNNFTVNNLTSIDQTTDTPTNNFATINSLMYDSANNATLTDGNLTTLSVTGTWSVNPSTLAVGSGKWYYEVKCISGTSGDRTAKIGWGNPDKGISMETQGSIVYRNNTGQKIIDNSSTSYGATWTDGDIIGVALDISGGTVTFYKNGTTQGNITISGGLDDGTFYIALIQVANTDKLSVNFGNPPYTANGYTDGAGYGNFSYAVPSGYYALNTKNLATFG